MLTPVHLYAVFQSVEDRAGSLLQAVSWDPMLSEAISTQSFGQQEGLSSAWRAGSSHFRCSLSQGRKIVISFSWFCSCTLFLLGRLLARVTLSHYFKTDMDITITCLLFKNSGFFGPVDALSTSFVRQCWHGMNTNSKLGVKYANMPTGSVTSWIQTSPILWSFQTKVGLLFHSSEQYLSYAGADKRDFSSQIFGNLSKNELPAHFSEQKLAISDWRMRNVIIPYDIPRQTFLLEFSCLSCT